MSKQAIFSPIETKILRLIRSNPEAVGRAMVAIYRRQTADEQRTSTTVHSNGRGFSAADAVKGTYYAKWVLSGRQLTGQYLAHAQEMARKYLRQLVEVSEEKRTKWEMSQQAKFN